jgi:hypothetical protein
VVKENKLIYCPILPSNNISSRDIHTSKKSGRCFSDKDCQWLVSGRCFSPCTLVFSTNKTDWHNITEILLKVALNTLALTQHIYDGGDNILSYDWCNAAYNASSPDHRDLRPVYCPTDTYKITTEEPQDGDVVNWNGTKEITPLSHFLQFLSQIKQDTMI